MDQSYFNFDLGPEPFYVIEDREDAVFVEDPPEVNFSDEDRDVEVDEPEDLVGPLDVLTAPDAPLHPNPRASEAMPFLANFADLGAPFPTRPPPSLYAEGDKEAASRDYRIMEDDYYDYYFDGDGANGEYIDADMYRPPAAGVGADTLYEKIDVEISNVTSVTNKTLDDFDPPKKELIEIAELGNLGEVEDEHNNFVSSMTMLSCPADRCRCVCDNQEEERGGAPLKTESAEDLYRGSQV